MGNAQFVRLVWVGAEAPILPMRTNETNQDKLAHMRHYASRQGYVTELCHLSEMPDFWRSYPVCRTFHIKGLAGRTKSDNLRAIVAFVGNVSNDLLAAALAHEIGHLHQFRDNRDKGDKLDLEVDAWDWAIGYFTQLSETTGLSELSFTPEMAELALFCLNNYKCPNSHPIMGKLWEMVG